MATSTSQYQDLQQLSHDLNLPIVELNNLTYDYLLVLTDAHLEIRSTHQNFKPIFVDFLAQALNYRQKQASIKNEIIARAVGLKPNYRPHVLDATAGLGQDSFILACLGCSVHLLERSKILAALLKDGIQRLRHDKRFKDLVIELIQIDAIEFMHSRSDVEAEVVYLDPMFPERSKSALVKKEMRILRDIVGEDEDAPQLLKAALKFAKKRVVVKRPLLAPSIDFTKPDIAFKGKASRFDVYLLPPTIIPSGRVPVE